MAISKQFIPHTELKAEDLNELIGQTNEEIEQLRQNEQAVSALVDINKTDIAELKSEIVVDLSVRYSASYANLSAALVALNSDTATDAAAIKKAGVFVKFINSTTNKYEQWNLKASSWSTATSNWVKAVDSADIPIDKIESSSTQSEEEAIIYEMDGGTEVGKIDANGADFINLKRGGQQVARMSDLPTKDSSIGDSPSTTNVPTTKAVKDYVDAHSGGDYPIDTEATSSEDEEQVWGNDAETQEYVKVGSYGMKSKAYLDMQGNSIIDGEIGDTPSTTHAPSVKAVKDYVDEHGGGTGDLPISKEDTQSDSEEQIWGNEAETDTYAKIGNYGIKAKGFYDLNGNPIGGSTQPLNVEVMLPTQLNIVEGQNIYICPDSILHNVFANDVHIKYGSAYLTDRTAFNISRQDSNETVGTHNFNLKVFDKNWKQTNDINLTVNTISKDVAGIFKVCVIGDSKTDNGSKLAQLLYLTSLDSNLSVELLGTKESSIYRDSTGVARSVKREGYSGRNISDVCTSATLNGVTNIFYDSNISDTIKFSFAKGVVALEDVPDILWVDHGANQAYNWTNNKKYYDAIIASVATYNTANNTNVKVVISIQERFAMTEKLPYAYRGDENDAAKRITLESFNQMISDLEGRENEGIFICPQYLNIDLWNDFPLYEAPIGIYNKKMQYFCADTVHMGVNSPVYNAENTYSYGDILRKGNDTTELYVCLGKQVTGIEPNDDKINWAKCVNVNSGYYKNADMYYATLKYIASLTN